MIRLKKNKKSFPPLLFCGGSGTNSIFMDSLKMSRGTEGGHAHFLLLPHLLSEENQVYNLFVTFYKCFVFSYGIKLNHSDICRDSLVGKSRSTRM